MSRRWDAGREEGKQTSVRKVSSSLFLPCVYITLSVHLSVCLSICHVQMMIHNIVYIEERRGGRGWHEGFEVYLYNVCVSVFNITPLLKSKYIISLPQIKTLELLSLSFLHVHYNSLLW